MTLQSGTMDYGTGDELYKQVIGQQQLLLILTYVLMGVGPLMVLLSGGFLGYRGYKQVSYSG